MYGPNEFWLALHRVVVAYRDEGLARDERFQRILEQLSRMPNIARRELLTDFALIARDLPELYAATLALQRQMERIGERSDSGAA